MDCGGNLRSKNAGAIKSVSKRHKQQSRKIHLWNRLEKQQKTNFLRNKALWVKIPKSLVG
jgi:hypothetical protein